MRYEVDIQTLEELQSFAALLAEVSEAKDVITLNGDLGAGKTEFARAFIRYFMGEDTDVPSPTFSLVQHYDTNDIAIWHFDLYRLENENDVWELGLEDALQDGITLIEWPTKIPHVKFKNHIEIAFKTSQHTQHRLLILNVDKGWRQRIESIDFEE